MKFGVQSSKFKVRETGRAIFEARYSLAGFTLIEMLVVISIIGVLAALLIGVYPAIQEKRIRARVKVELTGVETAIESYKEKKGFYPPDGPKGTNWPQLYYELTATPIPDTATNFLGVVKIVNDGEDMHNFYANIR